MFRFLTSLLFVSFILTVRASDLVWTNSAGGNWSTAVNWSPNAVPGSADNAYLTNSGTYTVTLDVNVTVSNLVLGAASGTQTLSNSVNSLTLRSAGSISTNGNLIFGGGTLSGTNVVSGVLNWTGGTIAGLLTVATNGTLNISGAVTKALSSSGGVVLTNLGTIVWTGGDIYFNTAKFYNQPGALFDIHCNQSLINQFGSVITNTGLFQKSAVAGTTTIVLPFYNFGTVAALTGTMSYSQGGTLDGSFTAAAGTTINFVDGVFTLDVTPGFSGSGTIQFTGGNIYFTVPIISFSFGGGTLSGTNVVTGTLNWTGGNINGSLTVATNGTLNISDAATKSLSAASGVVMTNWGTIVWSGGDIYFNNARFYNQPGALFDIQCNQALNIQNTSAITNSGLFQKSTVAGTSTIQVPFYNTGTVSALIGTLSFTGGGVLDGTFTAAAGTTINFASGAFTFDVTPDFEGAGTVHFVSGNIYFTVPIANFTFGAGTLSGTNVVTGVLNWTGGTISGALTVATNGTLNISGAAAKGLNSLQLTNWGTTVWTNGGDLTFYFASFNNEPGALFDIGNNQTMEFLNTGVFTNAGLLRKSSGTGTSTIQVPFFNTGTVSALSGTISFTGGGVLDGTFTAAAGTTINFASGAFTFDVTPDFEGAGTVHFVSGNIYFTVPITNFRFDGGTLSGTNVVTGVLDWAGGNLSGVLTVATNGLLKLSGTALKGFSGATVTNWGTTVWTNGGDLAFYFASFNNQPGALFDIWNDQTMQFLNSGVITNAGLFRKSAGTGTTSVQIPFYNTGMVSALNGTIAFTGGGTLGGTFTASAGASANFGVGSFTLNAMPDFEGAGTVHFVSGNIYFTVPITNFRFDGGTLSGTNTVTGVLDWAGGNLSGVLTVATNGLLKLSGTALKGFSGVVVTNWGTTVWTNGGDLAFYFASFNNQPGALFDIWNDQTMQFLNNGVFTNAGLFRKSAGAGTTGVQLPFYNTGTVSALNGTIAFTGGGTLGGTFTAAAGAAASFGVGSFTLNAMPDFEGAGTVHFVSGNIYFTVPITNFRYDGGTLSGTNVVTGVLDWAGGNLSGVLTVATNGLLKLSGTALKGFSGVVVTNWGTTVWTNGGDTAFYFASFNNEPGALFDIWNDQTMQFLNTASFTNAGLFRKSAGTGTTSVQIPFYNTGTVSALNGTIAFTGGGTLGGTFTASAGAAASFGVGSFTLNAMPDFEGVGTVHFVSGNIYFTVPISNFTFGGGALSGTNVVTGTLNWTGGIIGGVLTVASNGLLNISGPAIKNLGTFGNGAVVTNWGTTVWTNGGDLAFYFASFINQPGALFDIGNDQTMQFLNSGVFTNAGLFRKSAGTGTMSVQIPFYNIGMIEPLSGIMSFGASTLNLLAPGTVQFLIGGKIPGVQFGQMIVSGQARLNGTLSVGVTNNFVPNVGDNFRVMTWASKQGGFIAALGRDLSSVSNGLYFQVQVPADRSGLILAAKTTNAPPAPALTNLVDQTVALGDTAFFTPPLFGVDPRTYQWQLNGTNLPGQTAANLVLPGVQTNAAGSYCVVVTDALLQTITYCANLSVLNAQVLTTQPASQTATNGSAIILTVTASSTSPLSYQYQWRLNGANIPGANGSSYTVTTNAQPSDGGFYDVLVSSAVRTVASTGAVITVTSPPLPFTDNFPGGSTNGLNFTGSGDNSSATSQANEPLIEGNPPSHSLWLQWTAPANGVMQLSTRGSPFDTVLAAYTGASLTSLTSTNSDDDSGGFFTSKVFFNTTAGGNYLITVDGSAGAAGHIVLSGVLNTNISLIPQILLQPVDVTAVAGGTATFTVFAASTTNLTYQWYEGDWLLIHGATNTTLTLTNVSYLDVDTYSVTVTGGNGQGADSLRATLEIGPSLSFDKLEVLIRAFQQSGGGPRPFLPKGGGGGLTPAGTSFPSVSVGSLGSQLLNNFNSTTQSGEPVQASTIGGASRWYVLTAAGDGTMVVDTLGSDIATLLSVYNYCTSIYSLTTNTLASDRNSASDGIHSLARFTATNGSSYFIVVDGVNGAQGNVNLEWRMGIPPNVVGAAQPLAIVQGTNLLFKAGVSNNVTAPGYQWQLNGVKLAGATNSTYALTNILFNQCGSYSVVVSNLVGVVTNAIALVSVSAPLKLALDATVNPANFRVSGSATQAMVLQLSTNLSLWNPLYTNATPLLPINYLDTNSLKRAKGFYRLKSWP